APHSRATRAKARSTSGCLVTSHVTDNADPLADLISRVASSPARSRMATRAPCFANSVAIARPIPEPPPVTTAVRPASFESGDVMRGETIQPKGVAGEQQPPVGGAPVGGELVDDRTPLRHLA